MAASADEFWIGEENSKKQKPTVNKKAVLNIAILGLVTIIFVVGFLVGYFVKPSKTCETISHPPDGSGVSYQKFHETFQDLVSNKELEASLRLFSQQPHIAGSLRQRELALVLANRWKSYGFDKVEMPGYKVLLSYPRDDQPNKVSIVWDNGTVDYQIVGQQQVRASPGASKTFSYTSYLAYTPNGTVLGDLVYANYGSDYDFEQLKKMNVTVKGKIVLIRSRNVRGPEKYGVKGVVFFADPFKGGDSPNTTYPRGQWLPADGVVEGSVYFYANEGDPLTPGIPSLDGMYRLPYNESRLPGIPAQPISYGSAMELLRRLGGDVTPEEMRMGIGFTFRLGPGFGNNNTKIKLEVNNYLQEKTIYNVIGTIKGSTEPDRIVLVGNHRDSWIFGAVDASSGTSVTSEIARGLGLLRTQGWRPRRTIKICSWGGEEFNLIGSTEWVEQNQKILTERGVAYINLDIAVGGNYVLKARTSPLFKDITYSWAQKVKDPNAHGDKETAYDIWLERNPSTTSDAGKPRIYNLYAGSDYAFFYNYIGLPCGDYGYWFGHNNSSYLYPVYHSQADTFYWMKNFTDPQFALHKLMTQFGGGMLLDFSDSAILPFSVSYFARAINDSFNILQSSKEFKKHGISLDPLEKAVTTFMNFSERFENFKSKLNDKESFSVLRRVNDQMSQLEKAFTYPLGLPGNPYSRHVAFGYGNFHNLQPGIASFPGVTEALHLASKSGDWDVVERQVSIAVSAVLSGAQVLELY